MSLVLHGCHLVPLVFLDVVLLYRTQALLTRETAEDEDTALANRDGVRIPALRHLGFV